MIRRFSFALLLSIVSLFINTTLQAQVSIVATIKPLQMIASAITDGINEPAVLIPSAQSYHHFVLRPSSVRAIDQSELLIWVGPELETYLVDVIEQQRPGTSVLQVLAIPGLVVHHSGYDAEDNVELVVPMEGSHAGHQHLSGSDIDPHIWLDTRNGRIIARAILEQLIELDPGSSEIYQKNLASFEQKLDDLELELVASLEHPNSPQYAVYHDAFRYFERQFGLRHDVVFVGSEDIQPGIRHMLALRDAVNERSIGCLMEDVTSQTATINTIVGNKKITRIKADTTGQSLTSGPTAYIQLIENLANAFRQCFDQ
ncbi:MAG: zinc ABC transporter substrate-binding protein [Pseudohongiella sp.]|nr:zinc ABC transporter substrate-binding protein [Pseudohongiella sp.]